MAAPDHDPTEPGAHDQHVFKATALLTNLRARMRGGDGPALFGPEAKQQLSTEALAHAVLALNGTLNRIFPTETADPTDQTPEA